MFAHLFSKSVAFSLRMASSSFLNCMSSHGFLPPRTSCSNCQCFFYSSKLLGCMAPHFTSCSSSSMRCLPPDNGVGLVFLYEDLFLRLSRFPLGALEYFVILLKEICVCAAPDICFVFRQFIHESLEDLTQSCFYQPFPILPILHVPFLLTPGTVKGTPTSSKFLTAL